MSGAHAVSRSNFTRDKQKKGPEAVNGWSGGKWWKVRDRIEWTDDSRGARLLACGGCSGAVAKTAVAPLERIKMLLQVSGGTPRTTIAGAFATVLRTQGAAALWQVGGWS